MTFLRLPARDRGARIPSTDWLLGGVGVSIAGASASFAAYMIATAPAVVTGSGSKDWNVFVRYDKRAPVVADGVGRQPPGDRRAKVAEAGDPALDLDPTGSIPAPAAAVEQSRPARPAAVADLTGFVLRGVVGNKALIEHSERLSLVKPGSILGEAGEVLAIERRGSGWVVKTAAGTIGSRS